MEKPIEYYFQKIYGEVKNVYFAAASDWTKYENWSSMMKTLFIIVLNPIQLPMHWESS